MNKFQKLISGNGDAVLVRRASTLATQAEIAQQNIVNTLKQKKSELELAIDALYDLSPETRDSLRPGSKNWNANDWATSIQQNKWELWQVEEQLKIAEKTYIELFTEFAE